MLRLIGVEFRRFSKRAAFRWAGIALIVILGAMLISIYRSAAPPDPGALAQAQVASDENNAFNQDYYAPGGGCEVEQAADPTIDFGCDSIPVASTPQDYLSPPSTYSAQGLSDTSDFSTLLLFFALVVGISFVTAEFSSGAITNWLTFQPRRTRVYAAKAIALTGAVTAAMAVLLGLLFAGRRLAYSLQDSLGDNVAAATRLNLQMSGRILVLTVLVTLMGMALGMLLRHAAMALGLVFGYLIWEGFLRLLTQNGWRWLLTPRIEAWTQGQATFSDPTGSCSSWSPDGECLSNVHYIFQASAGWYLLGATVVLTGIAWAVFRRRDVI